MALPAVAGQQPTVAGNHDVAEGQHPAAAVTHEPFIHVLGLEVVVGILAATTIGVVASSHPALTPRTTNSTGSHNSVVAETVCLWSGSSTGDFQVTAGTNTDPPADTPAADNPAVAEVSEFRSWPHATTYMNVIWTPEDDKFTTKLVAQHASNALKYLRYGMELEGHMEIDITHLPPDFTVPYPTKYQTPFEDTGLPDGCRPYYPQICWYVSGSATHVFDWRLFLQHVANRGGLGLDDGDGIVYFGCRRWANCKDMTRLKNYRMLVDACAKNDRIILDPAVAGFPADKPLLLCDFVAYTSHGMWIVLHPNSRGECHPVLQDSIHTRARRFPAGTVSGKASDGSDTFRHHARAQIVRDDPVGPTWTVNYNTGSQAKLAHGRLLPEAQHEPPDVAGQHVPPPTRHNPRQAHSAPPVKAQSETGAPEPTQQRHHSQSQGTQQPIPALSQLGTAIPWPTSSQQWKTVTGWCCNGNPGIAHELGPIRRSQLHTSGVADYLGPGKAGSAWDGNMSGSPGPPLYSATQRMGVETWNRESA